MIAIETGNAVFYAGHCKSHFITVFILADDTAANFNAVSRWQFAKRQGLQKPGIAFSKGVFR